MVGGQAILFVKRPRNYSFFELETETGRLIIGPSPISLWGLERSFGTWRFQHLPERDRTASPQRLNKVYSRKKGHGATVIRQNKAV